MWELYEPGPEDHGAINEHWLYCAKMDNQKALEHAMGGGCRESCGDTGHDADCDVWGFIRVTAPMLINEVERLRLLLLQAQHALLTKDDDLALDLDSKIDAALGRTTAGGDP